MLANSTPTAPAPTMTMSLGTVSMRRMSSLVTMCVPSGSSPGSDLTRDPVARMTSVALQDAVAAGARGPVLARLADADLARPVEPAAAGDPGHLVLVDERLEAGPHPLDHGVAPGGHRRVVDVHVAGHDHAVVLGVADAVGEGRRFEQRLGRDAAAVEARAADLVLVDQRDLEPQLAGPERGRVAARARAEHDEIEIVGGADGHGSGCLGAAAKPAPSDGWAGGSSRSMVRAARRDAQPRRRSPMLDSGHRVGPDSKGPRPCWSVLGGPGDRGPDGRPDAHRLPGGLDPGGRPRRPCRGRGRPTHDRLRADRRHQCAAGAGPALGCASWSPATCSRARCRSSSPAS